MIFSISLAQGERPTASFELKKTVWWKRLCSEVQRSARFGQRLSDGIPARVIELHALLHDDPERTLLRDALLLYLVAEAAEREGVEADGTGAPLKRLERLAEKLHQRLGDRASSFLPLVLERRDLLANAIKRTARQREYLAAGALSEVTFETQDAHREAVLAWYRNVTGARGDSLESLAAALGVPVDDVASELLRSRLFLARPESEVSARLASRTRQSPLAEDPPRAEPAS